MKIDLCDLQLWLIFLLKLILCVHVFIMSVKELYTLYTATKAANAKSLNNDINI